MNDQIEIQDKYNTDSSESQHSPYLCCCYVIDEDGNYTSPCHIPVEESDCS
jgi:hypothetical protein